jgi:archaemetzincin
MTGAWTALLGLALLLAARAWWRRHAFAQDGVVWIRGTVVREPRGSELEIVTTGGRHYRVDTGGASRVAWPWRRELRVGDRVAIYGVPASSDWSIDALRIVPGSLFWPVPPPVVTLTLAGILLLRATVEPVAVEREFADGQPSSRLLLGSPAVRQVLAASRRIERLLGLLDTRGPGPPSPTLLEYLGSHPNAADGQRRYLYVQPIGPLSPGQRRVVALASDFLSRYTCLPVRLAETVPISRIPERAQRVHPHWGVHQLLTTYLLHELLWWRRPKDAAGYLGVTAVDIWPGEGWHAVYGQASLVRRVGVVSLYRAGSADGDGAAFRRTLLRTIKLAVHETGHIFSMRHCANDGCIMSGHNDREQADRRFPVLCPRCLAKLLWATRCDPVQRYRNLAAFCRRHGLPNEALVYRLLLAAAEERY